MENPMWGKLPLDQVHILRQADRQDSFEGRVLTAVFRAYGVTEPALRRAARRLQLDRLSMDWFNSRCTYPVKLAALRFHGRRKARAVFRDFRSSTVRFESAPEMAALADLQDGYPGEDVALISAYPDWSGIWVFDRDFRRPEPRQFFAVRGMGEDPLVFERLEGWLAYRIGTGCPWDPQVDLAGG